MSEKSALTAAAAGAALLFATATASVAVGPGTQQQETAEAEAESAGPGRGTVKLPDLSVLEEAVANQVRSDHGALMALLERQDVTDKDLAGGYALLGQTLQAYELFDAAESCYRNASLLEPEKYDWVHLLGVVNVRQGKLEEGIGHLGRAAELKPDDPVSRVRLGDAYLELGRLEEAEQWFDAALERNESMPAAHAGLGQLALSRRDFQSAVDHLELALADVPGANQLHYRLAMAYRGLGDMERAREHLQKKGTVGLRVNDPLVDGLHERMRGEVAYLLRGRLAFAAGDYAKSSAAFAQAVAAEPTSGRARVNYGTSLGMEGKTFEAMTQYRQALIHDPDNRAAHFNLGQLLFAQHQHADAVDHLVAVISSKPDDSEARLLLAEALVILGRDSEALAHLATVLETEPANPLAVVGEAGILVRLGRFGEARAVLEAGHSRMPTEGLVAHVLARLLAACPDASLRDGKRAVDLAARVVDAVPAPRHIETLALALAEVGHCEAAAEWQARLVDHSLVSGSASDVQRLRQALLRYQAGPPCRPPQTEPN